MPLTEAMTQRLWQLRKDAGDGSDEALVFPSAVGTPLGDANLYKVFKPAAKRAGVPWASFHTLRHTCATALFRAGKNPKQVQAWLGHHAASFTMDTYVHLLPDDIGEAPEAFDLLGGRGEALDASDLGQHASGEALRARQVRVHLTNTGVLTANRRGSEAAP